MEVYLFIYLNNDTLTLFQSLKLQWLLHEKFNEIHPNEKGLPGFISDLVPLL